MCVCVLPGVQQVAAATRQSIMMTFLYPPCPIPVVPTYGGALYMLTYSVPPPLSIYYRKSVARFQAIRHT